MTKTQQIKQKGLVDIVRHCNNVKDQKNQYLLILIWVGRQFSILRHIALIEQLTGLQRVSEVCVD